MTNYSTGLNLLIHYYDTVPSNKCCTRHWPEAMPLFVQPGAIVRIYDAIGYFLIKENITVLEHVHMYNCNHTIKQAAHIKNIKLYVYTNCSQHISPYWEMCYIVVNQYKQTPLPLRRYSFGIFYFI